MWFSPNNSSMLESEPFLVHDVLSPSKLEHKWLMSVYAESYEVRDAVVQADAERMNATFLRWLEDTRRDPHEDFLRFLVKFTRLGTANQKRVDLAQVAFKSAFEALIDRENNELFENVRRKRDSLSESDLTPVKEKPQKRESDENVSYLDLENGENPISSASLARAWRVADGKWQKSSSGRKLQLEVVAYLASKDTRGAQAYYSQSVDRKGMPLFPILDELPERERRYYQVVDQDTHRCMYMNLSNADRINLIEQMCNQVTTYLGDIKFNEDVVVWLPSMKKR